MHMLIDPKEEVPMIPFAPTILEIMSRSAGKNENLSLNGTNKRPTGIIDYTAMFTLAGAFSAADRDKLKDKHTSVAYRIALETLKETGFRSDGTLGNPVFTAQYLVPAIFLSKSMMKSLVILLAALRTGTRAVLPGLAAGMLFKPLYWPLALFVPFFSIRHVFSLRNIGYKRVGWKIKKVNKQIDYQRKEFWRAAKESIKKNPNGYGWNCFTYAFHKYGNLDLVGKEKYVDKAHNEMLEIKCALGKKGWRLFRKYYLTALWRAPWQVKSALAAYYGFMLFSVPTPCGLLTEALLMGMAYKPTDTWTPYIQDIRYLADIRYARARNTYELQVALLKSDIPEAKKCASKTFDVGLELQVPKSLLGRLDWLIEATDREAKRDNTPGACAWAKDVKSVIM